MYRFLIILALMIALEGFKLEACCYIRNITNTDLLISYYPIDNPLIPMAYGIELERGKSMDVPKDTMVTVRYKDHYDQGCPDDGSNVCVTFESGCVTISGGRVPSISNNGSGWEYLRMHHVNWCKKHRHKGTK